MGVLRDLLMKQGNETPLQQAQPQPQQVQPQVDSSNAIEALAAMMGPTPAEREASERRMQKNQSQMAMWAGLVDGLRQLGNLYYTAKGATPQKFDNPMAQVQQNYQQQRQQYNDMANYRRQYATSLYNLRRQMEADQRAKETHKAQLDWYKNREEQNTRKVDIQMFKAETDAAYKQATIEQKEKLLEIRQRLADGEISLKEARRQQALAMAGKADKQSSLIGTDVTTTTTKSIDGKGETSTSTKSYSKTEKNGEGGTKGSLLPGGGDKGKTKTVKGSLLPK